MEINGYIYMKNVGASRNRLGRTTGAGEALTFRRGAPLKLLPVQFQFFKSSFYASMIIRTSSSYSSQSLRLSALGLKYSSGRLLTPNRLWWIRLLGFGFDLGNRVVLSTLIGAVVNPSFIIVCPHLRNRL